jgi:hypothetical protein
VLAALARAVQEGGGEGAAIAYLRVDPVLRPLARRRLRRVLEQAMLEAPTADDTELCRLAYMRLAGAPPGATPSPLPRPGWILTALVALLALAAAAGLVLVIVRSMTAVNAFDASRRRAPPPAGAFVEGGVPAAPEATLQRFARQLPALVIAADRLSARLAAGDELAVAERQDVDAALAALAEPGDLPEAVHARLVELARATRGVVEGEVRADELLAAVGRLDDELVAAGLGLFVDGDVIQHGSGRRSVWLYAFRVESVRVWGEVRALRLRRLDTLNYQHGALGFARPDLKEALVLMDQVEDESMTFLLPALVDGASLALGDAELGREAAVVLRRELAARLGSRWPAAQRAGRLYSQREALIDRIEQHLAGMRYAMARPIKLYLPEGWLAELEELVPSRFLAELDDLDEGLADDETWQAFGALASVLAGAVERHEVQHRLDFADGGRLMPAALAARVGPERTLDQENRFAVRARDELSAYLAQLAWDPGLAGTSLVLQARLLLDDGLAGGAETSAALVIFTGLAEELGLPAAELVVRRRIDDAQVSALVRALLARPGDEVTAAAARLWARLFGEELPRVAPTSR